MNSPDETAESDSLDSFHRGAFTLLQPRSGGLKAGLDALLLAAFVDREAVGRAIDIGAGTGAVGLAAANRAPGLFVRLLEHEATAAARLRRTLALPENTAIAPRLSLVEADLFSPPAVREAGGFGDAAFDLALSNPPFHPHGHRVSPDETRRLAKSEAGEGGLGRWLAVSASLLREGGRLLFILPPEALTALLSAAPNRYGAIAILPVHTKAGASAKRMIVAARRGSRAPLRLLPGLDLAKADGTPTRAALAIDAGIFDGAALIA